MLIPSKYELEEGKDAPEGTVVMKCSKCQKRFAIPSTEAAKDFSLMQTLTCEACGEAADKAAIAAGVADMKGKEAEETVKTALGN